MVSAAAVVSISGAAFAADEDLVVFDWAGYEDPNFFQQYVDKHGDAHLFLFSDEEEAFQKVVPVSRPILAILAHSQ